MKDCIRSCGCFLSLYIIGIVEFLSIINIVISISVSLEQGPDLVFSIITCIVSFVICLFNIPCACCCLCCSFTIMLEKSKDGAIGLTILIIMNTFHVSFFVANCVIVIWWFILPINSISNRNIVPIIGTGISVCQVILIVYGIIVMYYMCTSPEACKRKDIEMVGM